MAINVLIPQKGSEIFTLFAQGNIHESVTIEKRGTYIQFVGVVVLFYKYSYHRRAYLVRSKDEIQNLPVIFLPSIRQPVGIINTFYGRKIDLLRTALWNIEHISGKAVYTYKTSFWQDFCCLMDNFDGKKSSSCKSNLLLLNEKKKWSTQK